MMCADARGTSQCSSAAPSLVQRDAETPSIACAATITMGYDAHGTLTSVNRSDSDRVDMTFDGPLWLGTTWKGAVVGNVVADYDKNFWLSSCWLLPRPAQDRSSRAAMSATTVALAGTLRGGACVRDQIRILHQAVAHRTIRGHAGRYRRAHAIGSAAAICAAKRGFHIGLRADRDQIARAAAAAARAVAEDALVGGAARAERARPNIEAHAAPCDALGVVVGSIHQLRRHRGAPGGHARQPRQLLPVSAVELAIYEDEARQRDRFAAGAAGLRFEEAGVRRSTRGPINATASSGATGGSSRTRAARGDAPSGASAGCANRSGCANHDRAATRPARSGVHRGVPTAAETEPSETRE